MVHSHIHAYVHTHAGIHGRTRWGRRWWCRYPCTGLVVAGGGGSGGTIIAHAVVGAALEERVGTVRCLALGLQMLLVLLMLVRMHLAVVVVVGVTAGRDEHLVGMHRVGERGLVGIAGGKVVGGAARREGEQAGQRIDVQRRQAGECGGHFVCAPVAGISGGTSCNATARSVVTAAAVSTVFRRSGADGNMLDMGTADSHLHSNRGIKAAAAVEVAAGERGDWQSGVTLAG